MSQALLHSGVDEVYLTLFVFLFYYNRNIIRGRSNAVDQMDLLEPALFKRIFRVDKETFSELLDCIAPFMQQKNLTKARNSSGSPIVLKARLAFFHGCQSLQQAVTTIFPSSFFFLIKNFITIS